MAELLDQTKQTAGPAASNTIVAEAGIEVARSAAVVYNQLLRVEDLPRFLSGWEEVTRIGNFLTKWTRTADRGGQPWTVEFYELVEDQRLSWRRVDGPRQETRIKLQPLDAGRTRIQLEQACESRASAGRAVAREDAQQRMHAELERFKRLLEAKPLQRPDRPRRVDLPCSLVDLDAPPHSARLNLVRSVGGWTLVASTTPGAAPAIARWLESMSPVSIRPEAGIAPKVVAAKFDRMPAPWSNVADLKLRMVTVTADGTASLFLEGPGLALDRFVGHLQLQHPAVRARDVRPSPSSLHLTPRQEKVISLAVALGYYEVPHRLTIRDLADKLGLSAGTVASTLRNAEGAIIAAFIDAASQGTDDPALAQEPDSFSTSWPRTTHLGGREPTQGANRTGELRGSQEAERGERVD